MPDSPLPGRTGRRLPVFGGLDQRGSGARSVPREISNPTFGVRASGSWFMEFDNVAIGIAYEKEYGAAKFHRFCYSDTKLIELSFNVR